MYYQLTIKCIFLLAIVGLASCVTQSANQYIKTFDVNKYKAIQIETCTDRTAKTMSRNIAAEATESLREKIADSGIFEIDPNGELMLTCDIERFNEGSALKRWLLPGWGATKAKITVMVWEKSSQTILSILSSVATVESGGLYTVGADRYIISVAINDIFTQLKNMSK